MYVQNKVLQVTFAHGVCPILVLWNLLDPILKRPSIFINNFKQVYYDMFCSWKSLMHFHRKTLRPATLPY